MVDTQADAETDDLDTIKGVPIGGYIVLSAANSARTVTLRDAADSGRNIDLGGTGQTRALDHGTDTMVLQMRANGKLRTVAFDDAA